MNKLVIVGMPQPVCGHKLVSDSWERYIVAQKAQQYRVNIHSVILHTTRCDELWQNGMTQENFRLCSENTLYLYSTVTIHEQHPLWSIECMYLSDEVYVSTESETASVVQLRISLAVVMVKGGDSTENVVIYFGCQNTCTACRCFLRLPCRVMMQNQQNYAFLAVSNDIYLGVFEGVTLW